MHVDVKKFGNIPNGGGWRYVGRRQGEKNRSASPDKLKSKWGNPKLGYAFMHTIIDDHSRVAYTEVHDDETAITAVGVLHRAVAWFAERGVTTERILSDNGGAYRSFLWRDTCEALAITPKRTRPYRPWGPTEQPLTPSSRSWFGAVVYEGGVVSASPAAATPCRHRDVRPASGKRREGMAEERLCP